MTTSTFSALITITTNAICTDLVVTFVVNAFLLPVVYEVIKRIVCRRDKAEATDHNSHNMNEPARYPPGILAFLPLDVPVYRYHHSPEYDVYQCRANNRYRKSRGEPIAECMKTTRQWRQAYKETKEKQPNRKGHNVCFADLFERRLYEYDEEEREDKKVQWRSIKRAKDKIYDDHFNYVERNGGYCPDKAQMMTKEERHCQDKRVPTGGTLGPDKRLHDLYEVLGVSKGCSNGDLKKAYRRQCRKQYPDRGVKSKSLVDIQKAYQILSDNNKRRVYDQNGQNAASAPRRETVATCSPLGKDDPLPEGWKATVSTKSGKTYYYNTKNKTKTWTKPSATCTSRLCL
jgi:DnaJ domain/WW domain